MVTIGASHARLGRAPLLAWGRAPSRTHPERSRRVQAEQRSVSHLGADNAPQTAQAPQDSGRARLPVVAEKLRLTQVLGRTRLSVGRQTVENCVRALAPEVSFLRPRRLLPQPLQPCRQAAEATQAPQGEDFERRHASALRLESATSIQAPQGPKLSVENPPLNPLGQTSAVASPAAASQPRSNPLTFFPTHPTSTEDSKWLGILGVALGG